jgi:fimbrial isopeptide formation D2 family protein
MTLSLLLIVFPLYAEGYRWLNPLTVPAAPLLQSKTNTSAPTTPSGATETATTGSVPTETATTGAGPTATATTGAAPTETATTGVGPTETATSGAVPTETATGGPSPIPTDTPTSGPSPTPTATLTPLPNEPPLRLDKAASASSVQINQKFNYTLTVFSNKTSASAIDVHDTIPSSLEVLGVSTTNGSCSNAGNNVTCQVTAQNNQPVTINILVQVRSSAVAGQRISNQALAQDDRQFTAASDSVVVDVAAGSLPSNTPGGPTNTPGGPTNTPGGPVSTNTPGPSPTPVTPTALPPNPAPTAKPSGGGGNNDNNNQPAATVEAIVLPPVPQEGFTSLPPTPRPGAARVPVAARSPVATAIPSATSAPTPDAGVFFSMGSDWGSAFTSQEINYDILFQNTRESGVINNLSIISALPSNLLFVSASAGYGPDLNTLTSIDPKAVGNEISLTLNALDRSQWVKISIKTKVKDLVATGARIVSQAEATFDGLAVPVRTKPVYVLVVGSDLGPSLPLIQGGTPSATSGPSATSLPSATPSAAPTAIPSATPATAGATDQSLSQGAGGAIVAPAPLPATSQGIPISGILLLGLTLLLRTVRIHRAQERI